MIKVYRCRECEVEIHRSYGDYDEFKFIDEAARKHNLEHHDERFYCEEYPTGEVPVDPPLGRPMRQDEVIGLPHIEAKVING